MTNSIASTVSPIETLADISRHRAGLTPDAPDAVALSFEGRETTYGILDEASNRVANGANCGRRRAGRPRRDFSTKNSDLFFSILLGAAKASAVLVPINARLAAPEIIVVVNDAQAEVLFIGEAFLETLAKIRDQLVTVRKVIVLDCSYVAWRDAQAGHDPRLPTHPEDVCIQMYTSGTTGHPTGVQLTHKNFALASPRMFDVWGNWTSDDVLLISDAPVSYCRRWNGHNGPGGWSEDHRFPRVRSVSSP